MYIAGVVDLNAEKKCAVGGWGVDIAIKRIISGAAARVGSAIADLIATWGGIVYRTEIGEIVSVTDGGIAC